MTKRQISQERQADAERLKKVWMEFKDKEKANNRKVSQEDVADGCGWSTQGAFSAYLNGRTPLNLDALIKLSSYFNVSPSEISPDLAEELQSVVDRAGRVHHIERTNTERSGRLVSVKAFEKMDENGYYRKLESEEANHENHGYVPSLDASKDAYAIQGTGNSMYPVIRNGWFFVCDPQATPHVTEFVEVALKNGDRVIKEYIGVIGSVLHLLSINSSERSTFDMDEVESVVPVIEIIPPSRHTKNK
ncbi:LexA family transcriptional regulator [Acinetobacter nectaris]|nr:LexA family transcriptional regulator [Acinetobacter nectaris]